MKVNNEDTSIILPGRIVEYFEETQTASVQVSVEYESKTSISHDNLITRRPIEDVPVHTPYGGGWSISFPIVKGDTCLVVFSQQGYDHWLFEDKDEAGMLSNKPVPHMHRCFSEDDGFCLVGFNTLPRAIKSYTTDGSQWRNEDAKQNIHLKADGSIEVNTEVSLTVNAPSVVINCDTAQVNASTSVTHDTPLTTLTGNLQVDGSINSNANINAAAIIGGATLAIPGPGPFSMVGPPSPFSAGSISGTNGRLIASDDYEINGGITLKEHVHNVPVTGGSSAGDYISDKGS